MLVLSLILFAIAALGGATMAVTHFQRKAPPVPVVVLHGVFAAAGLVSLLIERAPGFEGPAAWALILFAAAALGGFAMLLGFHLRKKALPTVFVLGHGGLAAVALVLLFHALNTA